jgi:hypothetical protein
MLVVPWNKDMLFHQAKTKPLVYSRILGQATKLDRSKKSSFWFHSSLALKNQYKVKQSNSGSCTIKLFTGGIERVEH